MVFGIDDAIAAAVIGPLIGGAIGGIGAQQQATAQSNAADKQMAYATNMSNTAHVREVQDLKNAGLNPILSGMGGSGSSTPSVSQAQTTDTIAPWSNSAKQVTDALINAKLDRDTKKQNLDSMRSQQTKTAIDTSNTQQDTQNKILQGEIIKSQMEVQRNNAKISNATLPYDIPAAQTAAALRQRQDNLDYKMVPYDKAISTIGTVLPMGNSAKQLIKKQGTTTSRESYDKSGELSGYSTTTTK